MTDAPPKGLIELRNKKLVCFILPELGGAVTGLDVVRRGETYNILQPAEMGAIASEDPRRLGLVHLAPYGGPLRNNGFKWDGKPYTIAPNLADEKLFRNGIVWQRAWTGKKDGRYSATLKYMHKRQPGWPFDFSLVTVFDLEEDNLTISYEIANEARSGTMPVGLGAELRLPRQPGTLLTAGVSNMWHEDASGVPTTPGEVTFDLDLKEGVVLDKLNVQRWFSGWTGRAIVDYPNSRLSTTIKTENMVCVGLSVKPKDPYFRLRALSHVPGVFDIKDQLEDEIGYRWLGAGESLEARIKIDVDLSLY